MSQLRSRDYALNAGRGQAFLALAVLSVIAPALPLGPLFQQPPFPFATLWLGHMLAAKQKPLQVGEVALMALLGLLHDQAAGGPYGLFASLYVMGYMLSRLVKQRVTEEGPYHQAGGFLLMALCLAGLAFALTTGPFGLGGSILPFLQTLGATVVAFPLVLLGMNAGARGVERFVRGRLRRRGA